MYTEKSVALKTDFYNRYGEAEGDLYFERTGLPCVLMEGGDKTLEFSLGCGVRAYGRRTGDVLRILNAKSNVCDVHCVKNGMGAQILYETDIPDLRNMSTLTVYTVEKILKRMGIAQRDGFDKSNAAICDIYGSKGWCALREYNKIKQVPLPLLDHNVLLIRTQKNPEVFKDEMLLKRFRNGESERISIAAEGLKKCRLEVLFNMLSESEKAIELLLRPKKQALYAAKIAGETDGVSAAKICDIGVICFVEKDLTDAAACTISNEFEKCLGYSAGIVVVK